MDRNDWTPMHKAGRRHAEDLDLPIHAAHIDQFPDVERDEDGAVPIRYLLVMPGAPASDGFLDVTIATAVPSGCGCHYTVRDAPAWAAFLPTAVEPPIDGVLEVYGRTLRRPN